MGEQLRQICRASRVRVTFDTTNTRDSFYRVSVDFVLNTCSRCDSWMQYINILIVYTTVFYLGALLSPGVSTFIVWQGPKSLYLCSDWRRRCLSICCWACWEYWAWQHSCCKNCVCSRCCTYTFTLFAGVGNFFTLVLLTMAMSHACTDLTTIKCLLWHRQLFWHHILQKTKSK